VSTAASRRFDLGHEELSAFGGTAKELSEVLLHLTVYCGFPAVLSGFRVLQAIKAEISSVK
jgi:alkylhydroperoxidase/carboxymuconolactone decarboxylase family protein YurZ